ncbi:MAG: cytochrome c, partial [Actinomycetia bacterium]|nr:cytochrome c [Actinomycetes bacterium]
MPGFSSSLTGAEIDAVASYVAGLGTGSGTTTTSPPGPIGPAGNYTVLCASCHGVDGRGTSFGPDILGESAEEITRYVRQGEDTMPAFGQDVLSDQELQELITYIGSLGGGGDDGTTDPPGQGQSGASIYASYCAGCHGSSGQGGSGPALADRVLGQDAIRSAIANGVGSMPGFSASLTAAEIDAVTSYVVGLGTGSGTTTTATGSTGTTGTTSPTGSTGTTSPTGS